MDIRSQLLMAAKNVCKSIHNGTNLCAAQLPGDQFCCRNNSGLIYVAEVVGTTQTNATAFLEYLQMLSAVEISLHDQTFSVVSSPSCPLSIPSAQEVNCSLESTIHTTPSTPSSTTSSSTSSTTFSTTSSITTSTTMSATPTATSGGQDEDSTLIVISAVVCLVGIVVIALSITGVLVLRHYCVRWCNHITRY